MPRFLNFRSSSRHEREQSEGFPVRTPTTFFATRTRCVIEKYKLGMFLDLLNNLSVRNAEPGEQPFTIREGDLLQIAKQLGAGARVVRRYRRRPETILSIDENSPHWQLAWVKFVLGLLDHVESDTEAEINAPTSRNVHIQRCDLQNMHGNEIIDSIAIPTTKDLTGGKTAIRKKFFPSAVREDAICLSYVQTEDGDLPETAISDWAWLREHIGDERNPKIWCDKLPLAGGANWWAKKAPLLYATQPILISPPTSRSLEYGSKMAPRSTSEELWHGVLFSTEEHICSCANCKEQLENVLSSLAEVIVRASHEHPARGKAGDMLKECSVSRCVDGIMSAEMAEPGWRLRLWPRMEATVALQARGAVLSSRGFFSVAKLVLFQSIVTAWALTEYGNMDTSTIEQSLGVRGMVSFWQPMLYTFRKCWAKDGRFDKGIYGAVMEFYRAESESYERSLLTRAIATDADCLCVQYMLQFVSRQESLNSANIWTGREGLYRERKDSLGPLALRVTVMELFRVPTETGDVFDPGDIIRWIMEVHELGKPREDAAPEMTMLDETRRYVMGIRKQDHCALGKYSGPHLELGWARYCSRERIYGSEEAWRFNHEEVSKATFVRNYYSAEADVTQLFEMTLAAHAEGEQDAVCVDHSITKYERKGFCLGWRCVDPMNGTGGLRLWFCSVNEEVQLAHLDCVMWIDDEVSHGGADDGFWISCNGGSKPTDWYETRGSVCKRCGHDLGTWAVLQDGESTYWAYASGIGAVPIWLPHNLV